MFVFESICILNVYSTKTCSSGLFVEMSIFPHLFFKFFKINNIYFECSNAFSFQDRDELKKQLEAMQTKYRDQETVSSKLNTPMTIYAHNTPSKVMCKPGLILSDVSIIIFFSTISNPLSYNLSSKPLSVIFPSYLFSCRL